MLNKLLEWNRQTSLNINTLFPERTDGCRAFQGVVEDYLSPNTTVVDIGGGRAPLLPISRKQELGIRAIGIDIAADELAAAPQGAYDETYVGDIAALDVPEGVADLVYSRAVAEHVADTRSMFRTTYRLLKPGGISLHFMPSRFALFATVNRILPHELSRKILFTLLPDERSRGGFKSYYRNTYPSAAARIFEDIGFENVRTQCYYSADYLTFFVPAHLLYVGLQNANRLLKNYDLCESFIIIGQRPR